MWIRNSDDVKLFCVEKRKKLEKLKVNSFLLKNNIGPSTLFFDCFFSKINLAFFHFQTKTSFFRNIIYIVWLTVECQEDVWMPRKCSCFFEDAVSTTTAVLQAEGRELNATMRRSWWIDSLFILFHVEDSR